MNNTCQEKPVKNRRVIEKVEISKFCQNALKIITVAHIHFANILESFLSQKNMIDALQAHFKDLRNNVLLFGARS